MLGYFYHLIFPREVLRGNILKISYVLSIIFVFNYLFGEGYQDLGIFNPAVNALFIILLPLSYLWFSRVHTLRIPLKRNPYFWISLGLVIPSLFGLFMYLSGDMLSRHYFIFFCQLQIVKLLFEVIGMLFVSLGFSLGGYVRFIGG